MQLRPRRRRVALNEAVHELRRPLQILALAVPEAGDPGAPAEAALRMATAALERLEREINGEPAGPGRRPLAVGPLLEGALTRWRPRAARDGVELSLGSVPGPVAAGVLWGDRDGLERALDNLIANALEHGGAEIAIEARVERRRLTIAVRDSGGEASPRQARRGLAELSVWVTGRQRRGHGLRVVRRVAAGHGGEFRLRPTAAGTEAALALPLAA